MDLDGTRNVSERAHWNAHYRIECSLEDTGSVLLGEAPLLGDPSEQLATDGQLE